MGDSTWIFSLAVLVLSVISHEVSHGYAASALGDPTARLQGRLTLNPIPHIDPLGSIFLPALLILSNSPILFGWAKPVPVNPYNLRNGKWGEALVAAAGPGANLLLALAFGLIVRFGMGTALTDQFILLSLMIVTTNVLLAVFNLVPIPPLDGSKILYSFLPYRAAMSLQQMEARMMSGGIALMLIMVALFVFVASPIINTLVVLVTHLITGIPMPNILG